MRPADDLGGNENHVGMTVQVVEETANPKGRAYEATVVDSEGTHLQLIIWQPHHQLVESITTDAPLQLVNFSVEEGHNGKTALASTSESHIVPFTSSCPPTLFHISDTHLGYHRRYKTDTGADTVGWEVDCKDQFLAAIDEACKRDVDAVVHTGDVFDDNHVHEDKVALETGLTQLASDGIPFYFVLGNHGDKDANGCMNDKLHALSRRGLAIHLSGYPNGHELGEVALYGVDYQYQNKWWETADNQFQPPSANYTVICLHQTIEPISDSDSAQSLPDILDTITPNFEPDLVLLGHLHRVVSDDTMSAYYAGPTAQIKSKSRQPKAHVFELSDTVTRESIPLCSNQD